MYRLEIVAGRTGIDLDHIVWTMFPRLTPSYQTPLLCLYATRLSGGLLKPTEEIMRGWITAGDILAFACEEVQE